MKRPKNKFKRNKLIHKIHCAIQHPHYLMPHFHYLCQFVFIFLLLWKNFKLINMYKIKENNRINPMCLSPSFNILILGQSCFIHSTIQNVTHNSGLFRNSTINWINIRKLIRLHKFFRPGGSFTLPHLTVD